MELVIPNHRDSACFQEFFHFVILLANSYSDFVAMFRHRMLVTGIFKTSLWSGLRVVSTHSCKIRA